MVGSDRDERVPGRDAQEAAPSRARPAREPRPGAAAVDRGRRSRRRGRPVDRDPGRDQRTARGVPRPTRPVRCRRPDLRGHRNDPRRPGRDGAVAVASRSKVVACRTQRPGSARVNEPNETTDPIAEDARLSAWLDGELDQSERAAMDELFATEPAWSDARDDTASVRDLVRGLPAVEPPDGFIESLLASDDPAPVADLDLARRRRQRRATGVMATLAVAAALLIAIIVPGMTHAR